MTMENRLWGQRRIQAELARLWFKVSARTVAKYMQRTHRRGPSTTWCSFLRQNGIGDLGVRLLLRPNDHVQTAVRVFRDPSRQPASYPCSCDAASDRLVDGAADDRMLRVGPRIGDNGWIDSICLILAASLKCLGTDTKKFGRLREI